MCCVIEAETRLASTIIYSARVRKPDGETVHSLLYKNSVTESVPGPNAMLLPIPTASVIGPENMVDGGILGGIDASYRKAVRDMKPKTRSLQAFTKGGDFLGSPASAAHKVFQVGSYTVASAKSAGGLAAAIREVPADVRPNLPARFLIALGNAYPGWSFIACCFAGHLVMERTLDPVVLWYRPLPGREDKLFAPAVDAHDGNPPDLSAMVDRDHCLVFGSEGTGRPDERHALDTLQRDIDIAPADVRWMFTSNVVGSNVTDRETKNGDFTMPISRVVDHGRPGYVGADEVTVEIPGRATA